jgi:protoglobin
MLGNNRMPISNFGLPGRNRQHELCRSAAMKHIDEQRLEEDLAYRVGYVSEFMGFGADDIAAIQGAAGHLAPLVPLLVDAVYDKLFSYDATKRHFVPRQSGYAGAVPESMETLQQDHEMIQFRKQHLGRYLVALVTRDYDAKLLNYLDMVGKLHTPKAGSPELNVPLVQMNALLGFVADALTNVVLGLGLDRPTEIRTLRAFNKLLWIQNDLITRHYQEAQGRLAVAA